MLKRLFRARLWLAGIIYPGEGKGRISYKDGQLTVANIKFAGVSATKIDDAILIFPNDGDSPFLIALEDAFDEFKEGHIQRMEFYKEVQEKLRRQG